MKNHTSIPIGRLLRGLLPLVVFAGGAHAADGEKIQDIAVRGGMEQQSIRSTASETRDKIAAIREELLQNGASKEDIAGLDRAIAKLGNLTDAQMKAVEASLQTASAAGNETAQRKALLDAFEGQRKALEEIASLAHELRLRNSLRELQARARKLLLDQSINLRATVALQTFHEQRGEAERNAERLVGTRQTALEREIASFIENMEFEAGQEQNTERQALQTCLACATKSNLRDLAAQAAQQTAKGAWEQASGMETKIRTTLEELSTAFQAVTDPAENLQQALQALAELKTGQKNLTAFTWRERTPEGLAEQARDQANLQDAAFVLKNSLEGLNAEATRKLDQAREKMMASSDSLAQRNADGSAGKLQEQATAALEDAQKELQHQLDTLPTATSPQEALAQLEKVQAEVQAELQQNQALVTTPAADAAPLANQVTQTQKAVLPHSPEAAQALGQASSDLTKNAGAPDTTAAAHGLALAADVLQKEIAQAKAALAQASSVSSAGQSSASKGQPGARMQGGVPGDQDTGLLGSNGADAAKDSALVVGGLKAKDREAINQLAREKVPEEYEPLVQQYMKSLADDSAGK